MRIIWNKLCFPFCRHFNKSIDSVLFKIYILSEDLRLFFKTQRMQNFGALFWEKTKQTKQQPTLNVGSVL